MSEHGDNSEKAMLSNVRRLAEADLQWLVCPACHGALHLRAAAVVCVACGRSFPVHDGLPVLLVERATPAQ